MPKEFRITTSKLFLTYPQCTLPKEDLFQFLREFFGAHDVQNVIVAGELHEDGSPHLHAYVHIARRWDCKNANALDYKGFHPNIQSVKNDTKVMDYVMKDGDFVWLKDPNMTYAACKDLPELETYITNRYNERFWLTFSDKIISTWTHKRQVREPYVSKYTKESFIPCTAIDNWYAYDRLDERPRCLVVVGASRLGKTQYVRALSQEHLYFKGGWRLDDWDDTAEFAVFDDWPTDDIPKWLGKRLIGTMDEVIATDKYRGKRRIKPVPAILILNDDPRGLPWWDDWWNTNTTVVSITTPLFRLIHNI